MRAKLIFGIFCIGGTVALLAVRAPAQQTRGVVPPAAASDQAIRDAGVQQGPYYLVRARDPRGIETRGMIEADSGQTVSAMPTTTAIRPPDYSPYYDASPRIISIPQADGAAPVQRRQVRVTRERQDMPRASEPQRPARRAARAPVQTPVQESKPEPLPPRRVVRQVVPPREQPHRPAAMPLPPVDPSPRPETPEATAAPVPTPRPQVLSPALSPVVPSTLPPASPSVMPPPAVSSDDVAPRTRPRTVLAPPPYAEGPTPLKPLHHRDSKRFVPAQTEGSSVPPETNAPDPLAGSDQHAAVAPNLPPIPVPQAADAHTNASAMALSAEDDVPPGTVTLDAPSR